MRDRVTRRFADVPNWNHAAPFIEYMVPSFRFFHLFALQFSESLRCSSVLHSVKMDHSHSSHDHSHHDGMDMGGDQCSMNVRSILHNPIHAITDAGRCYLPGQHRIFVLCFVNGELQGRGL